MNKAVQPLSLTKVYEGEAVSYTNLDRKEKKCEVLRLLTGEQGSPAVVADSNDEGGGCELHEPGKRSIRRLEGAVAFHIHRVPVLPLSKAMQDPIVKARTPHNFQCQSYAVFQKHGEALGEGQIHERQMMKYVEASGKGPLVPGRFRCSGSVTGLLSHHTSRLLVEAMRDPTKTLEEQQLFCCSSCSFWALLKHPAACSSRNLRGKERQEQGDEEGKAKGGGSSTNAAALVVVALTAPCLSNSATGAADAIAPLCCLQATAAAVMLPPHIIAIWVEGRGVGRGVVRSLRQKRQGGRAGKGLLGLPSLLFTSNQPKPVKTSAHIPQRLKRGS
ncbi:hypothetical protein B0H34DRAFT_812027 [Crassisporium funariophilum]|nr:hypothetical protein B0H34DRAFT_812027 [Crassisporium funariophilum]